ncbi:response regulator transcription factor [Paraburkholderia aspalathi]|nr:response regulator transcription factor [Paraburkholderia aspalathi]
MFATVGGPTINNGCAKQLKVMIAVAKPELRNLLRTVLADVSDCTHIAAVSDFKTLCKQLGALSDPDLVIIDSALFEPAGRAGLAGLIALKTLQPGIPVVVFARKTDAMIVKHALDLGVWRVVTNYLSREQVKEELMAALSKRFGNSSESGAENGAEKGGENELEQAPASDTQKLIVRIRRLTPQQLRVLAMLAEGLLNKQIAYELSVSEATVKAHVSAVLEKLGLYSRKQAVKLLARIGVHKQHMGFHA